MENSRPKPGRMEEILEGGRSPPRAVAALERERERERLPKRGRARGYSLGDSGALTTSERTKKNLGRIACNLLKNR